MEQLKLPSGFFQLPRRRYLAAGLGLAALAVLVVLAGLPTKLANVIRSYQEDGAQEAYRSILNYQYPWTGPNIGWGTAPPASQGIDGAKLDALSNSLAARDTKGFLVVKGDRIVYEWYASGYHANKTHYTGALQKAIAGSMALLLALNDDRVDLDDSAAKYIPAWGDDPQKSKITIRHLVTHSSGIEDVEFPTSAPLSAASVVAGDESGWKGTYLNDLNERFPLAIGRAPVLFEPGSRYSYSGVGFYALAYAIAESLRDAPESDMRTLLDERIMKPIGVPSRAWSMSYGESYELNGLELNAIGSGGRYSPRAIARIGQLMLDRGMYRGTQIISPDLIDAAVTYSGVPLDRTSDEPQPAIGLGWWVNHDGFWPSLPRDAFVGAGAQHQILLVVPSLDLVMVRTGEELGENGWNGDFWSALEERLFRPLMESLASS